MDLRCPKCNSTDLKKVSLAHQEGLYRVDARTGLRAVVVGGGWPDLVVGRARTKGSHQTELSKRLSPPIKWSYLRVISWSILGFLALGWLIFYVNTVASNSSTVLSAPLMLYSFFYTCVFVLTLFFVWRHNHSTYQRQYDEWNRSFICERCGAVSKQMG